MMFAEMSPRGQRLFKRCKEQLGYTLTEEQPHAEMLDYFSRHTWHVSRRAQVQDKAYELVPRNCFKTSDCTIGGTIDFLSEDPNRTVLIGTHTHDYTKQILEEIKWHFERNEALKAEIGDVKAGSRKWAEDAITFSTRTVGLKEPTIDTCALDKPKVGGHYDLILIDDLHNRENITPKLLRKAKKFMQDLYSVLQPGGVLFVIGTRWHNDDIFNWIEETELTRKKAGRARVWDSLVRGCYDGPGGLYFPTRLTREFIENQRIELDDKEFSCQYLNKPLDESMQMFSAGLIHKVDGEFVSGTPPYLRLVG